MIDLLVKLVGGLSLAFMWIAFIIAMAVTIGKLAGRSSPYKDIK
jgi:hypothetical protein